MNRLPVFQRTRLAPTPSGYLHLGNAFSFAITIALARQAGARIFLRIDDLDHERVKRAYVEDIFDTLDYLELPWDEGPKNYKEYETMYSQIHRLDLYDNALRRLHNEGIVFACDCSRSDVLANHPEGVYTGVCRQKGLSLDCVGYNWRLDTSADRDLAFNGLDGKMTRAALPQNMEYFVIRKRDGFPAYQLASVVDDEHFGVDFVVRGIDLWDSTLAQSLLAMVLDFDAFRKTTFFHHALLTTAANKKLSKSTGATSIQYFRKQGKTKAAVFQMIGEMAGLSYPIVSWDELGEAIFKDGLTYPPPH